jgi:allantoinase
VQFVINYEEGGENNILHGDAASETFLSEITPRFAVASTQEQLEAAGALAREFPEA